MFSRACQTFGQTSRCKVTNIAPTTTTNIIKALIQFVLLLLDIFYYLEGKQERIQNLCVESIRSDFYSSVVYVFLQSDSCFSALSFLPLPPFVIYVIRSITFEFYSSPLLSWLESWSINNLFGRRSCAALYGCFFSNNSYKTQG